MAKWDMPPTNGRSRKERLMAASKEIFQRLYTLPAQAVDALKKANRALDAFEEGFGERNAADKAKLIFVIGATATVIPGGYIALQIWGAKKLIQWTGKKLRRPADEAAKTSGRNHRPRA